MTDFATLEDTALDAELSGNWLHAATLWRQAAHVAVGRATRERCLRFHDEALECARRKLAPLPTAEEAGAC